MTEETANLLLIHESSPEWIKLTDAVPEKGQQVVYYAPVVGAWVGQYNGRGRFGHKFSSFHGFLEGDVTHWFPLPAKPAKPETLRRRRK